MKKAIILIVLIQFLVKSLSAQYEMNRFKFHVSEYQKSTKRYSPLLAAGGSYLVPGLGQLYCNETFRGLSFLGGYVGCIALTVVGLTNQTNQMVGPFQLNEVLMISGFAGSILIRFGSIFDAIKVAKINSIAYDHQRSSSRLNYQIGPTLVQNTMNSKVNLGLKLNVSF